MSDKKIIPEVGMGVTHSVGSDAYPYTIVKVINARSIQVTRDTYEYIGQKGGEPEYKYTSNPDGHPITITLRINGRWYAKGSQRGGCAFHLGHRRFYHDPSF
jgi:hypothetical protein